MMFSESAIMHSLHMHIYMYMYARSCLMKGEGHPDYIWSTS